MLNSTESQLTEEKREKIARARFSGADYDPQFDQKRLTGQILRIYDLMCDGKWRTLDEISRLTGDPAASVSAQLRNLRKKQFGAYTIARRPRGDRSHGLFEYCLLRHGLDLDII